MMNKTTDKTGVLLTKDNRMAITDINVMTSDKK